MDTYNDSMANITVVALLEPLGPMARIRGERNVLLS